MGLKIENYPEVVFAWIIFSMQASLMETPPFLEEA